MVLWVGLQSVVEAFPGQNKHTCTPYYLLLVINFKPNLFYIGKEKILAFSILFL